MRKQACLGAISLLLFFSCKKIEPNATQQTEGTYSVLTSPLCSSHPIIDSMPAFNTDADSTEISTILGNQRTNPYTISNMQQAYRNLGLTSITVNVTNLYVRFLPNSASQLSTLDSIMDAQNMELFDAPMDYDVLQEGNYYQDPSIPDTSVTWQYAVVPSSFVFPSGITHQTLSQIHIPGDNYTEVETEGERLASLQDSINCNIQKSKPVHQKGNNNDQNSTSQRQTIPYVVPQQCELGWHWDANLLKCVPDGNCPAGYYWESITQVCMPIQNPPPPSPDAQVPAGTITVSDVNLNTIPGVRNIRIVAKRWFKIERVYTDNNGHFQFTKRFKHKVKINVKFKNSYCNIRGIRGLRLWQSLYPVQTTIGVYSANKNAIVHNFDRLTNSSSAKGNRYWAAATTNNAIIEHRDYATQYGFSAPPMGLNVYLTNWGMFEGLASTPLFGKRFIRDIASSFISTQLVYWEANNIPLIGQYAAFFAAVARARLDMAIDYHRADMGRFTSDFIKETVYHECSHASEYTYSGNSWYGNFVNAELAEIEAHHGANDQYNPYGTGNTSNSPIIALGEAWGYHAGHFLAEQRYGTTAICQSEQSGGSVCCNTNYTHHPHIDVLENFIPSLQSDAFHWIPKGLMEDLIDNGEPVNVTLVNDQVVGFTTQQIFAGLQSDITSIPQYKARLLQQNNNNQQTQITTLFTSYGY